MAASVIWLIASERHGGGELADVEGEGGGDVEGRRADALRSVRRERHRRSHPSSREFQDDGADQAAVESYERVRRAIEAVKPRAGESSEAFDARFHEAMALALNLRRETSEEPKLFAGRVDQAFHQLAERAATARGSIEDRAARLARGAGRVRRQVASSVADGAESAGRYYDEHPLVVGALGLAAGAVLASVLPPTRVEDRGLGRAGAAVRRRSQHYAQQTREAAWDLAERVKEESLR
jgi:hypothetical protein